MSTFLRLELASREGDVVLVNVDHIARIHPCWPQGASIVMDDDTTSLHVRASVDELHTRLRTTGGRTEVYIVARPTAPEPQKYELEHEVDAYRAELAAEDAAAEAGYREMLAHPESVVDAEDLF